ncbi:MAG TPA: tryptophan 2,3-dioxygenase family protein, partial [Erythrobacter sp.]|nr:tryptophan 2,3-dioxygenase family protein [Erythrobacter sp.]
MAKTDVTYTSYLDLDRVLAAQHPASGAHDEMLFIIVHQASELWLKLCLHELTEARRHIAADNLRPAFKMLARVARAQGQLIQSWDVLSTMTPHDYSTIRPHLGNSSGFQSWQYRMMEFMLGGRNPEMISLHERLPEAAAMLAREAASPSIYDETVRLLARRGFAIDECVLNRDIEAPYAHSQSVEDAWAEIFRAPQEHWDLYELAEKLVDLEYHFQRWRFGHLKT